MNTYKPSDQSGFFFSLIIAVPFLATTILLITDILQKKQWAGVELVLIFIPICLFLLYYALAVANLRYIFTDKGLVIKCGFTNREFAYGQITEVELKPEIMASKSMGINLPGVLFGAFNMKGYKNVNLYVTKPKDVVLFKYKYETLGVTPEKPQDFVEELKNHISNIGGQVS